MGQTTHIYGTVLPGIGYQSVRPNRRRRHTQAVFAEIASAPGLEQARPSAGELAREKLPHGIAGVLAPQPKGSR